MSKSHAIVWPYAKRPAGRDLAEIFNIPIPDFARDPSGELPLGVLLSTVTAGPPGLMIIAPSTGKIVYWESMSSGTLVGLSKQKQTGIQGSTPGLFSGEVAVDVVNAEPSGILLPLSTGRVIHITVRDSQGKPCVSASFLRNSARLGGGGFLSGLKNVFGVSSWRNDLASIKAGLSHQRGQRDVLIATSSGMFEVWDTHWNNGCALKSQFNLSPAFCDFLGSSAEDPSAGLSVWDFVWQRSESGASDAAGDQPSILVLASLIRESTREGLFVFMTRLINGVPSIVSAYPVDVDILVEPNHIKPRLHVPKPGDTAFIVLGQRIVLVSLRVADSPHAALTAHEAPSQHKPAQDSIQFRDEQDSEITCTGSEDSGSNQVSPSCVAMVRGFGVVRIAALPRKNVDTGHGDFHATAKSKLEQAIFFGTRSTNPLNLVDGKEFLFPQEEVQHAALEICRELLESKSDFVPAAGVSLAQNLTLRVKALQDMAVFLKQRGITLDYLARWELLWSAEKLSAQRAIWKIEEDSMKSRAAGPTTLTRVLQSLNTKISPSEKLEPGSGEPVRQWILHGSDGLDQIIPLFYKTIKGQLGRSRKFNREVVDQVLEVSEMSLAVLETAFRYRDEHASMFGLDDEFIEDGVLVTGYEGLPEFWTSRDAAILETGHLLDLELDTCRARTQRTSLGEDTSEGQSIRNIAQNGARHLRILNYMEHERVRWLSAQGNEKMVDEASAIQKTHNRQRKWRLFKLAGIGHLHEAIGLAEDFRDMSALVELMIELQDQTSHQNGRGGSAQEASNTVECEISESGRKICSYFERFGEAWADSFFTRQISMGQPGALLSLKRFQPFVTLFLRKNPAYSRLAWINEILGERNYASASQSLQGLCTEVEDNVWSHRVELSLAKLSKLAAREKGQLLVDQSAISTDLANFDGQCEIDTVQEQIYEFLLPALDRAIDTKAATELAINHSWESLLKDRPSMHDILGDILAKVVNHQVLTVEQTVDLLTLIDSPKATEEIPDEHSLRERAFYVALRVLRLSSQLKKDPSYHSALRKLVWRRCMIKDDWVAIGKPIHQLNGCHEFTARRTALARTMALCFGEGECGYPGRVAFANPACRGRLWCRPILILRANLSCRNSQRTGVRVCGSALRTRAARPGLAGFCEGRCNSSQLR